MKAPILPGGTVHTLPDDLKQELFNNQEIAALWQDITPLARNEFICWIEDAKGIETRKRRIKRTGEELLEGKRRPCCWVGCIHRTDKEPGKWVKAVLLKH